MLDYMDWTNTFCVAAAIIALVLSGMLAISILLGAQRKSRLTSFSGFLFGCVILFAAANIAENLLDGAPGRSIRLPLTVACFCDYLFSGLLAFAGSEFLLAFADPKRERGGLRKLLLALLGLHVALLILAQCFGWYYVLDAANRYHRGKAYWVSLLIPTLMLLLDTYVLIFHSRNLSRIDHVVFWGFVAIPIIGVVLQLFVEDIMSVAVLLTSLLLHVFLAGKQMETLYLQQEENHRLKTEILISQIQPHFCITPLRRSRICATATRRRPRKPRCCFLSICTASWVC